METLRKNMDSAVKHWGAFRRQFPSRFKVTNLAMIAGKTEWVRHRFDTCNFSLILAGRGQYHHAGQVWEIEAPAVIIQLPDRLQEYGPSPGETWDELYIIYDRAVQADWAASGLLDPATPTWPMMDRAAVDAALLDLIGVLRNPLPARNADRLDRVCERLIFETRKVPDGTADETPAVTRIAAQLRQNLRATVDFDVLATQHGMSVSTFRRRWQEVMGVPPLRYLQELRIQEACRQLVETTRPVREIAERVGFEDGLYFSRRFRLETALPPREYRRRYRLRGR